MKQLALVAVLGLSLVACGGASSKSTESSKSTGSSRSVVLQEKGLGEYIQITGPPEATPIVARTLEQDPIGGGFVAAPAVHGHRICTRTSRIVTYPATEPKLRRLDGQAISIAVFSARHGFAALCKMYWLELSSGGAVPLLGENLTTYRNFRPFMEPTLHCSYVQGGCLAHKTDFIVFQPSRSRELQRGEIVVFTQTSQETQDADTVCEGEGDPATRRLVGLPGEAVREDDHGYVWIRSGGAATWTKLNDLYIPDKDRADDAAHFDFAYHGRQWHVPAGEYFVMSDNRTECDSRTWGSVPAANVLGTVVDIIRGGKVLKPAGIPG